MYLVVACVCSSVRIIQISHHCGHGDHRIGNDMYGNGIANAVITTP
jgi:hypothetical protein